MARKTSNEKLFDSKDMPKIVEGIEKQKALLEKEGHTIIQKGKKHYVKDYMEKLYILPLD